MVRVLVVDDQQLVRAGIGKILGEDAELEIVGECEDGSEVDDAVRGLRPDIVLMDLRMRDVDGAEATRRLRSEDDAPPVLVLTTFGDDDTVAAALEAGAAGFILKDAPGEDIIRAVRAVAGGGAWLDQSVAAGVIASYRSTYLPRRRTNDRLGELTEREREVLTLIGRGLSNHEIADDLVVTEATVKTHISHIFDKLQLRDRAAAIVLAFEQGLVHPGEI